MKIVRFSYKITTEDWAMILKDDKAESQKWESLWSYAGERLKQKADSKQISGH